MKYERNRKHFAISAGDSHVCFFRLQCVVTAHHTRGFRASAFRTGSARLRFARVPHVLFCAGSARVAAFKLLQEITISRRILLLLLLTTTCFFYIGLIYVSCVELA